MSRRPQCLQNCKEKSSVKLDFPDTRKVGLPYVTEIGVEKNETNFLLKV